MKIPLARNVVPALAFLAASTVLACNIPVFRYALERWRPDQCEVVVFHDGPLSTNQRSLLQRIPDFGSGSARASIKIITSDLTQSDAPNRELWEQIKSNHEVQLPYVVLRTQISRGRLVNGWHGPLDSQQESLSKVFQSPARSELSRRLLAGHSIVWLMIASKDAKRNEATRQQLEDGFGSLANKVKMPEGIGLPGSELHSEIPLLLRYSVLEIDRDDDSESFLVQLFSGFHPQAFEQGQPLVVPVFGRGRALEVIPAGDLNPRLMEDLTVFLSGACSCQVKDQNPGFDLLLTVDWDTELFGEGVEPPPVRTTRDREKPQLLTIPPGR
ncbi:MAG: hypothetical protein AB8B91_20910 [Rubripirellula sp.]